jgi:hypothetical protein
LGVGCWVLATSGDGNDVVAMTGARSKGSGQSGVVEVRATCGYATIETWLAMHGKRRVAGAGAGASASAERDRVKGGLGLGRYGRLKTAAQDPKRSLISGRRKRQAQ